MVEMAESMGDVSSSTFEGTGVFRCYLRRLEVLKHNIFIDILGKLRLYFSVFWGSLEAFPLVSQHTNPQTYTYALQAFNLETKLPYGRVSFQT